VKVFVLGSSGAGKTPVARLLAEALGVPHVPASEWVRAAFRELHAAPPHDDAERSARVTAMTRFSVDELRADPRACLRSLEGKLDGPCVVEGMRNPFDFVHAFDPRSDAVVLLTRADNALAPTSFERGLDVIRAYLEWLRGAGLLTDAEWSARVREVSLATAAEIERTVDGLCAQFVPLLARSGAQVPDAERPQVAHVHADIAPLALFVDKPLLYGGDARFAGDVVPCTAFAFSSYPGSAPTFKLLLADGAIFSYVAPSALRWKREIDGAPLPLDELAYHACKDGRIAVHAFAALRANNGDVLAFLKKRDAWMKGTYAFTVDWYDGNDLLHCVLLENGQVALLPHHKLKFGVLEPGFAPYKKLRNEWFRGHT
jgi:hypothetical protein